jgi:ankyrin repeat protein
MFQLVHPSMLFGNDARETPLYRLADLADHSNYSTHQKQLILAKQLIDRGANVNAVSIPVGMTPLHKACYSGNVTNLDFVELLLEKEADPNVHDHLGKTPLMYTTPYSPGAAKFLLNWPTMDSNIKTQSGQPS